MPNEAKRIKLIAWMQRLIRVVRSGADLSTVEAILDKLIVEEIPDVIESVKRLTELGNAVDTKDPLTVEAFVDECLVLIRQISEATTFEIDDQTADLLDRIAAPGALRSTAIRWITALWDRYYGDPAVFNLQTSVRVIEAEERDIVSAQFDLGTIMTIITWLFKLWLSTQASVAKQEDAPVVAEVVEEKNMPDQDEDEGL